MKAAYFLIKKAVELTKEVAQPATPAAKQPSLKKELATVLGLGAAATAATGWAGVHLMGGLNHEKQDPAFRSKLRKAMNAEAIPHLIVDKSPPVPAATTFAGRFRQGIETTYGGNTPASMSKYMAPAEAIEHHATLRLPPAMAKLPSRDVTKAVDMLKERGYVLGSPHMDPAVLAHEYGHLTGSKGLHKFYHPSMRMMSLSAPLSAAVAGATTDPNESAAKGLGKGALKGAAISLLAAAPHLAEEARASIRAMRGMRAAGATPAMLAKGRSQLTQAFLTYLATPVVKGTTSGAVGAAIGRKLKSRHKNPEAMESVNHE